MRVHSPQEQVDKDGTGEEVIIGFVAIIFGRRGEGVGLARWDVSGGGGTQTRAPLVRLL